MAENNSSAPLKTAEGAICERCAGSGEDPEGFLTTGRGPNDYTVDGPCRQCGGSGEVVAAQAAPAAVAWENFPCYLIDHCEGDVITEEGLQRALAAMLANPKYAATPALPATEDSSAGDLAHDTLRCAVGNCTFNGEVAQHAAGCQQSTQLTRAEVQAEPVASTTDVVYRWQALDYSGYSYGSNPPTDLPERCNLTAFYRQPDAYRAALHEISATSNLTATSRQFGRHLQQIACEALAAAPQAQPADALAAARYRHLRDGVMVDGEINEALYVRVDHASYPNRWALVGQELDEAIDASMAAAQEGGNAATEA